MSFSQTGNKRSSCASRPLKLAPPTHTPLAPSWVTARSISLAAFSGSARLAWHQKSKWSGSARQNADNSSLQMRAYSLAKSPAQYMKQWDGVDITNLSTPRSAISLRRLAWLMRARMLACASASVAALAGCLVPREKCPTVSPCTFMNGPQNSWRFSMPSVSKWAWTSISMAFSLL
ncbi:hypothetical protein D3C85_1203600 [compost metagenome]